MDRKWPNTIYDAQKKLINLTTINKKISWSEVRPHRVLSKRTEILESQFQTSNYYNQCGKLLRMIREHQLKKFLY